MTISGITISGNVISWSGPPNRTYSVTGIGKDNETYVYYTGLTSTSAIIYSPSKNICPKYIQSFLIETISGGTTYSGSYSYYLGALDYVLSNGVYSVNGIDNTDHMYDIIIPSLFNELPVASIGQSAFNNHIHIENVIFEEPTMISSIPVDSFRNCAELIRVNIPSSVTSIGTNAFNGCSSLLSISLPENLQTISESAFGFCTNISAITIPIHVTTIGASSFTDCGITTLSFSQPSSVTTIGASAFDNCVIASVRIPASVTTIGDFAFSGTSTLYFEGGVPSQGTGTDVLSFDGIGYYYSIYTGWDSYVASGFRGITMNSIESIQPPILTTSSPSITNLSSVVLNISGAQYNYYSVFDNDVLCASGQVGPSNVSLTISNLSPISHTFKAMFTNTGISSPYTYLGPIIVDTNSPNAPILSSSTGAYSDSSSIILTISGEASASYSLFNGSSSLQSDTLNIFGKAVLLLTGLSDQTYNFKVRLTDAAGNQSSYSNIVQTQVITNPPAAPTISPTPSLSSQTVTISGEVGTKYYISMTDAADISGAMVSGGISYSFMNLFYTKSYTLSVTLRDAVGNSSSTTRTWRPPFNLSLSGTNLMWNSELNANSGLTYHIYSMYSDGSMNLGTRSYPPFSLTNYGGLTMSLNVVDSSQNSAQLTNVSIPIDASFSSINTSYLTGAFKSTTSRTNIKSILTTYASSFTTPTIALTGISGSKLIDPSQQSIYSLSSYDNRPFTIVSCPSGGSLTIDPTALPTTSNGILYFASSPNTSVSYTIGTTNVNIMFGSSIMIIGSSSYGYGSVFQFGNNNYRIVAFSSIVAEPYTIPTNLAIDSLNRLSWIGNVANTSGYRVYNASGNILLGSTTSTVFDLSSSLYPVGTYYVVGVAGETVSSNSQTITYMPASSLFAVNGNVLTWNYYSGDGVTYDLYTIDGETTTLVAYVSSLTYTISNLEIEAGSYTFAYRASYNGFTSPISNSVSVTYMPASSSFSAYGTVLTWNYGLEGATYNLYTISGEITTLRAASVSSLTYNVSSLDLAAGSYTFVYRASYNGVTSTNSNSVSITIDNNSPPAPPGPPPIIPAATIPCFLHNAPVLTPAGYTKISKLSVGDEVITADGRTVNIQRILKKTVAAGPSTNPYMIPKGMYGSMRNLAISPNHRVVVKDGSLVEARFLGLKQQERDSDETIEYYNIELPDWQNDNMIVAGVAVESLAPVRRVSMQMNEFKARIVAKYGRVTPEILALIDRTCTILPDGRVECPVLIQKKK